jgi:hypothetical protein
MSEEVERSDNDTHDHQRPDSAEPTVAVPADTLSLLIGCIDLLAARAWEAMGLVPTRATGKVERRLEDAQLAIDAAAALVDLARPRLQDSARREVETLLANLRINFVEQKSRA